MNIHGSFENSQAVKWYVYFRSDKNPSINFEINNNTSGVWFASDAVTISHNYESTFQHIIKRSAVIDLVTDIYLGDYFFGYNARDIQVLIFRELELVFAGFVEANQYNQTWAGPHDTLTINCVDVLSTLEYFNYANLKNDTQYQAYKQGADNISPKQLIQSLFQTNLGTVDFVNNIASKVYWDQSKSLLNDGDIMNDMKVSELLFLDDDFDSLWTSDQVLNEVLQYLNLHIVQLGRDFFIYDNEYMNRIDSESKPFKDLLSNSTLTKQIQTSQLTPYTLQKSHYNSDDTNLSIDEVFNKIEIKCNLIDNEDVIESPFDDDTLTSPFSMRQIFATEAVAQGEGTRAKKAFWTFVKKGRYLVNQDDYDGVTVNDYYLQYMTNPNWVFYDGYNNNIDTYLEQDSDGNYYKQWKVPSVYPWVTGAQPSEHGLVTSILSFGVHSVSGQAIAEDDAARMPNKLDQANYIVMSINGNQKHDSTHTPTDNQLQQASPAAVYTGAVSGGVYSPPDDETTNYIVFSGTLMYQPVETTKKSYSWTEVMNMNDWGNITSSHTVKYLDGEEDDDKKAYRTIKWYNTDYPTSIDDTTHYTTVDMLDPCFSNSIQKSKFFDYNYSQINGYHVGIDTIKNLGVIECEMIIGDKCLAEDYDEDGNSIYEWVDKTTGNAQGRKTFSLGINPKLGDSILGQEFKISNNITFKMNLDNAEGTAIPIKKSDNLSGKVEFKILGPVNQVWNDITRRHSTWFRSEKFYDNDKYVLSEVKNIVIKDFEAKFYSDNGGYTYNTGQDLIYMSVENDMYINKKSDIEFKINSALTSEECKQKGIKQGIRITNPVYNGEAITKIASKVISDTSILEAKPEELYIDQYYREYSKPRLMVEVSVNKEYMEDLNEIDVYGSITKLNSLDKAFRIVGISYDSETESRLLVMKEIGEAASGSDSTGNKTTLTYTIYATGNPLTVADPTSLTYTWTEEEDSTWYAVYTVEVDSEYADSYTPNMAFIDKGILDWQPIMTTITIPVVYATDDPNNPAGSLSSIVYTTEQTDESTHYTSNVVCTVPKEDADDYTFNPNDFTPTDYTWLPIANAYGNLRKQYLTFTNNGQSPVIISNTGDSRGFVYYKKLSGGDWYRFSEIPQADRPLQPGESMIVKADVNPGNIVSASGRFRIIKNQSSDQTPNVEVSGNCLSMVFGDDFINNLDFYNDANPSSTDEGFFYQMFMVTGSGYYGVTNAYNLVIPVCSKYAAHRMFKNDTQLTTAPKKLYTTTREACYAEMFYGCTNLVYTPVLPDTTVPQYAYYLMFRGCTSLQEVSQINATSLNSYSCYGMFWGCTSLEEIPEMNITSVSELSCYRMFYQCSSLEDASMLTISSTAVQSHAEMFSECSSLTDAPVLSATTLSEHCYYYMFYWCTSLATAPELPATSYAKAAYGVMFSGDTNLSYVKCMLIDGTQLNESSWLINVSSTGTFVKSENSTWNTGPSGIPEGWTVETV